MTAAEPLERLLTPSEVADLLGVAVKTLYRWSHRRGHGFDEGPACLKVGGHLRYHPQAIRDYLQEAGK